MSALLRDLAALLRAVIEFNLALTATAIAIALPLACLFATARLSRRAYVYWPVTAYVNVLRSSPLLMRR